jgi:hypothetical protein
LGLSRKTTSNQQKLMQEVETYWGKRFPAIVPGSAPKREGRRIGLSRNRCGDAQPGTGCHVVDQNSRHGQVNPVTRAINATGLRIARPLPIVSPMFATSVLAVELAFHG